jgi:predicted TIM-barrel fold metal-dependent hydrolase
MSEAPPRPFVVDAVIHAYNFLESNMVSTTADMEEFRFGVFKHHRMFSPLDERFHLTSAEFIDDWAPETLAHAVFAESQADMAVYHTVPMYDFWKDGSSALEKGLAMKAKHPDRVLVYGAVNPLNTRDALAEATRQVRELGVDGIKLYPASFYGGKTIGWRMDDATFAFPLFEKLLELEITNVAVHKAMPLGPAPLGPFKVDDIGGAAAAFPEINFQIVHGGYAFVEETALMLHKFPNIFVNLEATASYAMRRPKLFAQAIGEFLYWGSPEQIIFASGVPLTHPRPAIDAMLNLEMPKDLIDDYGYPEVTDADRNLMVGGNLARLHGIDPAEQRRRVADDEFSRIQRENGGPTEPWSYLRSGRVS